MKATSQVCNGSEPQVIFLEGGDLTAAIQEIVKSGPVTMAVAYWGNDAVKRLQLPEDLHDFRIACDVGSGACSPVALKTLLDRGARVVDVPRLHAKVYHSQSCMIVASANASTNGLAEDDVCPGLEAGTWTNDEAAVRKAGEWINKTIACGNEVRQADFPAIRTLWNSRRRTRPTRDKLAQAILENGAGLSARPERAYIYDVEEEPEGVKDRFKRWSKDDVRDWDADDHPFFWGDLPKCEANDILLCFEWHQSGRIEWVGAWQILEPLTDQPLKVWPSVKLDQLIGVSLSDMEKLSSRVGNAVRASKITVNAEPPSLRALAEKLTA